MRRNVVTYTIWLSAVALFLLHLILTQRQEGRKGEKQAKANRRGRLSTTTKMLTETSGNSGIAFSAYDVKPIATSLSIKRTIEQSTESKKMLKLIEKQKEELSKYKKREKQLKNLARRLAAKLKGKEGGLLPKLDPSIPWVFAITPTYARFTQKADLVRLSQTLMHVTNLHWIVVEDSPYRTDLVSRLLHESGLSFTHLNLRTPEEMQRKRGESRRKHHRGVVQRNLGLKWLRDNIDADKTAGAVYFMDDDNTYHIRIFDEIRWTKHVSVWLVALAGGARWCGPIVEKGKVIRFFTNWAPERLFPVDMSGFAINLRVLLKDKAHATFDKTARRGHLEPTFLKQLTTLDQLEPLGDNATKVLVWHTRTEVPKESIRGERALMKAGKLPNINIET